MRQKVVYIRVRPMRGVVKGVCIHACLTHFHSDSVDSYVYTQNIRSSMKKLTQVRHLMIAGLVQTCWASALFYIV